MRVLLAIESLRTGGKERQFIELLKGLKKEPDIAVEVVIMSDRVDYDAFGQLDVPHHILTRTSRFDLSIFARLRRLLRESKPDIVHSWASSCSLYLAPLAALRGTKFINGYIRDAPPRPSFNYRNYLRGKLTTPFSDIVVANSAAGLKAYGISPRKGRFVYNGFDATRLATRRPISDTRALLGIETPHVVGMVAAFEKRKDYDSFFAVARRITAQRDDVTFLAIGDGETFDAFRRALPEAQCPKIRLLGRRQDVESIVDLFTVGVLASNSGEGIPNAVMEYMALSKPVVATDSGGTRELIVEGETGFLVPPHDVEAFTRRVLQLLDDPALAAKFGAQSRSRLLKEFSLEKLVNSYVNMYRSLLPAHSSTPAARAESLRDPAGPSSVRADPP